MKERRNVWGIPVMGQYRLDGLQLALLRALRRAARRMSRHSFPSARDVMRVV